MRNADLMLEKIIFIKIFYEMEENVVSKLQRCTDETLTLNNDLIFYSYIKYVYFIYSTLLYLTIYFSR